MISKSSEPIVLSYFKAVDAMDIDELMALFNDDASLHYPVSDPIVGKDAIRNFYSGVFKKYASGQDHIRRLFFSEDGSMVAEIYFEAVLKNGRSVEFEAVDIFTIVDNRIQKIQVNFDSAKILQEIGPPPN